MNTTLFWNGSTVILTLFTVILIPVYWYFYGARNFLWFSDIGLFLIVIGLNTHSQLLLSMAAVGVLAVEIAWNADFFLNLLFKRPLFHLADYMFNAAYPSWLRGLSLFHIFLPIILIAYVMQYGYDKRALLFFTLMYWCIVPITYLCSDPKENINWVFAPEAFSLNISPIAWLLILCFIFPLFVFLPTHYLLQIIAKS